VLTRRYRDGLMIACLAVRPLRLANFIGLGLGGHLQRRGTGWWLEIPAAEAKTQTRIAPPFPAPLAIARKGASYDAKRRGLRENGRLSIVHARMIAIRVVVRLGSHYSLCHEPHI
jgi:hypothetical protein